jgi:hypothetical protein
MEQAIGTRQRETLSVFYPRLVLGCLPFVAIFIPSLVQPLLSCVYSFLYRSPFYGFSGFETIETVLCYIIIEQLYPIRSEIIQIGPWQSKLKIL